MGGERSLLSVLGFKGESVMAAGHLISYNCTELLKSAITAFTFSQQFPFYEF